MALVENVIVEEYNQTKFRATLQPESKCLLIKRVRFDGGVTSLR